MVRVRAHGIAPHFIPVRPAVRAIITGILITGNGMHGASVVTPDTKCMATHVVRVLTITVGKMARHIQL